MVSSQWILHASKDLWEVQFIYLMLQIEKNNNNLNQKLNGAENNSVFKKLYSRFFLYFMILPVMLHSINHV